MQRHRPGTRPYEMEARLQRCSHQSVDIPDDRAIDAEEVGRLLPRALGRQRGLLTPDSDFWAPNGENTFLGCCVWVCVCVCVCVYLCLNYLFIYLAAPGLNCSMWDL